jgi:predicted DNA-binding ribbon-helix-helix protein
MLKRYLEQRHIDLDSGRSCLALEREYWHALEVLAYEDGDSLSV